MAKTVYLIVTDLHGSYKNFVNRVDYRSEMVYVFQQMLRTAKKYRDSGYTVNLILLGDVFHRSYNDVFNAVTDNNFFITWKNKIGNIYSVLGNHELSFYASNPFYTLVSNIESKKIQSITNYVWQPVGTTDTIRVPDTIEDGNVVFHFNHYQTAVDRIESDGKVHVGLFHQEIVNSAILESMAGNVDSQIFAKTIDVENTDLFDGYSYCFMGHLHKVFGTFLLNNGCYVEYLASLGRTNISEVLDTFLDRDIPAVVIEDGEFSRVENNFFKLQERSLCVKETIVKENEKRYEIIKERREIRNYNPIGDEPLENLKALFVDNPAVLKIMADLTTTGIDGIGQELRHKIKAGGFTINEYSGIER